MKTVNQVAIVDRQKCTGCADCVWLCPSQAINIEKLSGKQLAIIDEQRCLDCILCVTRCPEHAIRKVKRDFPLQIGSTLAGIPKGEVAKICLAAHMYPDQIICYCNRVQAKEVAAAILRGAKTPEDVSRATGARTGCGTLCISGIIRLLRAAGIKLTKAPGYQWYGIKVSIWDIPPEIQQKYAEYYLSDDLRDMNKLFPQGK